MEKTAFQVRAVKGNELIETDDGGLLKGYSEVVSTSTTIHSQVRSGIKAPNTPLSIGVDAEYTRTDCSSRHVVGLKVKNRTISFLIDFDDVPKSWVSTVQEAKDQIKSAQKVISASRQDLSSLQGPRSPLPTVPEEGVFKRMLSEDRTKVVFSGGLLNSGFANG